MELLKLIKNRISTEWKKTFNDNVDILNGITRDQNQKIDTTNKRIDNLVLKSGKDSSNEVVDARVNNKGETFETLEARLLETENTHDTDVTRLDTTQTDQQKQLEQLNNAIGRILGTYNSSISIFVSKSRGSDEAGDGTETNPFKTIQMAANLIPLISTGTVTIFIDADVYLEDVVFASINGTKIYIRPIQVYSSDPLNNDMPVKVRSIAFNYCSGYARVSGIQFVDNVNTPFGRSLSQINSGYLGIETCKFGENSKKLSHTAVFISEGSKAHVYGNTLFKDQATALFADFLAEISVSSAQGSGNNVGVLARMATARASMPSAFATTVTSVVNNGLIITKGTVLS